MIISTWKCCTVRVHSFLVVANVMHNEDSYILVILDCMYF